MEETKVIQYLKTNQEFLFGEEKCSEELVDALLHVSEEFLPTLQAISFQKPGLIQILAVFPALERFLLGDKKGAILKYCTFFGLGVWWIKDILSAKKRCREYNCKKLLEAIADPSVAKVMIEKDSKMKKAFAVAKAVAPAVAKGAKDIQNTMEVR